MSMLGTRNCTASALASTAAESLESSLGLGSHIRLSVIRYSRPGQAGSTRCTWQCPVKYGAPEPLPCGPNKPVRSTPVNDACHMLPKSNDSAIAV